MIKRLCIFTINFAFNRQGMLDFLEKSLSEDVELFLFVSKECRGKFSSKRIKIYESNYSKHLCFIDLRKFCKKNNIERIFSMGALPQEGFLMAFASAFRKTKSFCHMVVNPYFAYKTGFNKPAIKAFFEYLLLYPMILLTDKFYVAIKDIYEKSRKTFFFSKPKIEFLIYPVDSDFFKPKDKVKCRKNLKLPLNQKIILYVGRVEYEKGSDIILELAKENKDILFLLIGDIFDKNLEYEKPENMIFLGSKKRELILDYYNSADLCIFPSRAEAGPSAARESLCCGTQVIVPDMIGPRMLAPPAIKSKTSFEEFNLKTKEYFELSKKKRGKLSKELREFVVNEYSQEKNKQFYIDKLLN